MFKGAFDVDIPSTIEQQMKTGKLVEQNALTAGDIVFFDGKGGFGPFAKPKIAGIVIGKDQVALADKDLGVTTVRLTEERWKSAYKTARRMPTDPNQAAPAFDAAAYGDNREALLRDVAKAWVGTLYLQGGKTFDGIGNDEFVRSIYEAINDTELDGTPKTWETAGVAVKRSALKPGDIILYEAVGLGKFINQKHAGMYIGNGEFVHAVKGSAVTISKLKDPRWSEAFRSARRIDPDVLTRQEEKRDELAQPARGRGAPPSGTTDYAGGEGSLPAASTRMTAPRTPSESEARLRDAVEPWRGTPYKIGGTSKSGVDCSALVRAIYEEVYGVKLPRTAEEQETLGAKIDRKGLETGDLVFFRTQGMGPLFKSRHVGIYLGGGEFAQSSGSKGVNVARLDNRYWNKKYEGARRLPKS